MNVGAFDPLPFPKEPKKERQAPAEPALPRDPDKKVPIGPTDI